MLMIILLKLFFVGDRYYCPNCPRHYKWKKGLNRHRTYECGTGPLFMCHLCAKKFHHKTDVNKHLKKVHKKH